MDPDLKAKWVASLRSGKYVQGQGLLRTPFNTYCCLGVLCDIAGIGHWEKRADDDMFLFFWNDKPYMEDLVGKLREESGLSVQQVNELVKLNDNEKWDFGRIADWIEANV